jgi:aminoglycoside phosphotransferase (APT) family kinase protein
MPVPLAPDDIVARFDQVPPDGREPLLVLEPLREFLQANALQAPAELSARHIGEGHSNVTFALSTGVVLRRPPRGPLPPSAHDVLREARLLSALAPTVARTPRVLATCEDPAVIGAPFYVMEMVRGVPLALELPPELDEPAQRGRIADELIDALVELHGVDWQAAGLEGFGKPTGYLERQVRRFLGLWEHNRTRELPVVEEVASWLSANMPQSGPATIVHGDYRLGNTMYEERAPARLTAILDWEMATIGDPLADVGYMLMMWPQADDPPTALELQSLTRLPGFPTRTQLIERYEQRSGRSMHALDFYVALALFKAVVFMEGNYKRAAAGSTDDPFLKGFGQSVVELAERALDVTRHGFA